MKKIVAIILFLLSFSVPAQERFIDNLFETQETITRTYAIKDGEDLKLDIYQPANDTLRRRPVIVFMHGGGFSIGSRMNESEVKFAQAAASKGYVAVSISYRLTRKGKSFGCDYEASGKIETFQKAAEDFMDAVNFLVEHKEEYNIDPNKIIAGGSSAGAEAVLNAIYNSKLMFSESSKYRDIKFMGVFSLAGALIDTRYITKENAVPGIFFHGTEDKAVPFGTAPHHFCGPNSPGYIILDGSKSITERLRQLGFSYVLYSFKGGGHEISRMPFEDLPEVFRFFNRIFFKNEILQVELLKQ